MPVALIPDAVKPEGKSTANQLRQLIESNSKTPACKSQPQAEVKATPVAAAIIADKKVDVKTVTASGSNGKIIKQDVLEAISNPGRKPGVELFGRNDRHRENEQPAQND